MGGHLVKYVTSTLDLTHAHVQPYTIPYPYTAERRRTRPYTIFGFSEIGYVSLM